MSTTTGGAHPQMEPVQIPSGLSSQLLPNLETLQPQLAATTSLLTSAQTELEHLLNDVSGAVNQLAKEQGQFVTELVRFWFGEFVTAQGIPVGALGDGRVLLAVMGALGQTFQAVSQSLSTHGPAISAGMGAIALAQQPGTVLNEQQVQDVTGKIDKLEIALGALGGDLVKEADTLTGNVKEAAPSSMTVCYSGVHLGDSNTVPADLQPNSTWPGPSPDSSGSPGSTDPGWKVLPPFGLDGPSSSSPTASPSSSPFTNLQPTSLPSTPTPLLFTPTLLPPTPGPTPPPGPNVQSAPGQGPLNFPPHLNPTHSPTPGPTPGQISLLTGSGIAAGMLAVPGPTFSPGNNPNLNPGTGPNFNPRAASEFITTTVPGTGTSIETSPDTSPTRPQDFSLDPLTPGMVPALFPPASPDPGGPASGPTTSPFTGSPPGTPTLPTPAQDLPTLPASIPVIPSDFPNFVQPESPESSDPVFPLIAPGAEPFVTARPAPPFDPFTFTIKAEAPASSSPSAEPRIVIEPPTSLIPEPGPGIPRIRSQPAPRPIIISQDTSAEPSLESTPGEPRSLVYPDHAEEIQQLLQQYRNYSGNLPLLYRKLTRPASDPVIFDEQSGLPSITKDHLPSHAYQIEGWQKIQEVINKVDSTGVNPLESLINASESRKRSDLKVESPLIWTTTDIVYGAGFVLEQSDLVLLVIKLDPDRTPVYRIPLSIFDSASYARAKEEFKKLLEAIKNENPFVVLEDLLEPVGPNETLLGPYIRKQEILLIIRVRASAYADFWKIIQDISL